MLFIGGERPKFTVGSVESDEAICLYHTIISGVHAMFFK